MKIIYLKLINKPSFYMVFITILVTLFFYMTHLQIPDLISAQEKIVNAATLDDYPPYCFSVGSSRSFKELIPPGSDSKSLQGFSWDILRESLHSEGYTIKLTVYPWKRAVYDTKSGIEDIIFPMIKNKEREHDFYFSSESVDQVNFLVYVPLDSTIEWNGLESLNGLTIGAIEGWSLGKTWSENTQIKKYNVNSMIQGFKMLDMQRLHGFAGYEINFDYFLKKEKWKSEYKKLPSFDASIEYVAGSKTNLRAAQLIQEFDSGKKKIVANKTFNNILTKWGVKDIRLDGQ